MRKDLVYYIIENYGINHVDLSGLDDAIIKEIIEGLESVYSKYPLIFEKIGAIGREEFIKKEVLNKYGPKYLSALEQLYSDHSAISCFTIEHKRLFPIIKVYEYDYISILITDKIFDAKKKESSGDGVIDSLGTIKSIIVHELGHVLDHLLGLSSDRILKNRLISIKPHIAEEYKTGRIVEVLAILF